MDLEDNKKYSKIILALFVLIAIFTVIWGLFLNFGELKVVSKAPYQISILAGPTVNCDSDECLVKLKPGNHTLSINKNSYEKKTYDIEVSRWQTTEYKPELKFIPSIEKISEEGREDLYAKREEIKKSLPKTYIAFTTNQDASIYAYLAYDTTEKSQALFINKDGKKQALSYFPRLIESAELALSKDLQKLAVFENTVDESSVYIVDLATGNKENIHTSEYKIVAGKWSNSNENLIIQSDEEGFNYYVISPASKEQSLAFIANIDLIDWLNDEELIFATQVAVATTEDYIKTSAEQDLSFEDYLVMLDDSLQDGGTNETIEKVGRSKTYYFYRYNIENNAAERLVSLSGVQNLPVELFVKDEAGKSQVYFWDEQDYLYRVVLE